MSRHTSGRRWRLPVPARLTIPPCFDGYPYLVSRIGRCALRHIALVPADWTRERIVAIARAQAEANHFETAACFGPDDAVYVDADGDETRDSPSPSGIYAIERLQPAESFPETEELAARRARVHDIERASGAPSRPMPLVAGDSVAHHASSQREALTRGPHPGRRDRVEPLANPTRCYTPVRVDVRHRHRHLDHVVHRLPA